LFKILTKSITMKKNILFLLFLLISHFAQEQKEKRSKNEEAFIASLRKVVAVSIETKNLKDFDTFKATHNLDTPKLHSYFYAARAYAQNGMYRKALRNYDKNDANLDKIAKNILADYQ
jgi:tetratricopeptide (TPR) repeat protein